MAIRSRLWLVWIAMAFVWIVGVYGVAVSDKSIPSLSRDCRELLGFRLDRTGEFLGPDSVAQCESTRRSTRFELATLAIGPALGLIVIGVLLSWIPRGNLFAKATNIVTVLLALYLCCWGLIFVVSLAGKPRAKWEPDAIMLAFLSFLAADISRGPDRLKPLAKTRMKEARELTKGTKVNDNESLPNDVTLWGPIPRSKVRKHKR
jgi:hypothetical protein